MLPAPSLATYNGLIFISMDPDAEPLEEFLGDFKFYLDYYTKQSADGIELRGPQRWRVKANWKIGAENFAGDMYHTPQTHTSVVEIGLFREPKAEKRKDGTTYWAGNGGGTTYKLPEGSLEERLRYVGYPDEMIARMKEQWTQEQLDVVGKDGFMISAASLFPNMSFVHNWPRVEEGSDEVLPFISIRVWQPISENETEVLSWFAVDKNAPEEYKALSYKAYLMCFGSGGMFEQDDVENWVSLTNTAAGSMARRLLLNSRMGMLENGENVVEALSPEEYSGPGSTRIGYSEYNQREFFAPMGRSPRASGSSRSAGARGLGPGEGATGRRTGGPPPGQQQRRDRARSDPARGGLIMSVGTAHENENSTLSEQSALGAHAPRTQRTGQTLPFNDELHLEAHRWLIDEAYLLDAQDYSEWLSRIADDVHYIMPVRVTTALGAGYTTSPGMAHWDENKYSLSRRVARFATDHAWTEDPPSRLRHYITNVRTFRTPNPDEIIVDSAVLLFRSRGDVGESSTVSAGREDLLRRTSSRSGWELARRTIMVDESVIRMQNLAIFL